ncbi:MAG: D-alanyl-D-alanine carboxypeptidase family protein [Lachnospiraceae bacterium]
MIRILTVLLSTMLCIQPVHTMSFQSFDKLSQYTQEQENMNTENTDEENAERESVETESAKTENEKPEGKDTENEEKSAGPQVSAPSALLMEASTGQVIYEKDADSKRPPASVTKVMTLLLIFDALDAGKIKLEDEVTVSEYAASMGGSQVFLEPGEVQTVDTLIKCISVASANDACVAMAEFICGSEEEFVSQMNKRAKGLGMENTHFKNCNGLDTDGHLTTARDIALMSRELITKYPKIHDYCMIWMENITHTTKKGTTEFGLSNTNKLVRHYQYATGLKTGSTSKAKFCISATGEKDDMEMIAVIMAADDSKIRNKDAITLLNYGFSKCQTYKEDSVQKVKPVKVRRGVEDTVGAAQEKVFTYVDTTGADLSTIKRKVSIKKEVKAPVKRGTKLGEAKYYLNGKEIGSVDILATENIKEMSMKSAAKDVLKSMLL